MARQSERSAATIEGVLGAAQRLFMTRGFDAVSIDEIAAAAGIAKGGFYHHFSSKQSVFEAVLDRVQAELASQLESRLKSNTGKRTPETIAMNILAYLKAASAPGLRQLILIDGPVVLGWKRCWEIDDHHFFASIHSGLVAIMGPKASRRQVESAARLVAGATMEAALVTGSSENPVAVARVYCATLRSMLYGLQKHP
ncbi:TetR family transcriptional regulator [Bradyrhizobium sp. CCBAU 051011]|uniref:TetR/AcrR family transcriptional regulator n=1 Tax=Bradyrhizobium sp. CCBAU 051011 TaxID=858422 RepID=UPI0013740EA7|nr:TetR/AcrR family transcriptional regulator [Bradyrhizobium sp. CCBAU 051011]QHO74823.1 TetR family transcriptional regulator [Bradyrhizobium sp. CCBAU 051011]